MSIYIANAYTQHGWDPCDHMIDDRRIETMIGKTYPSVGAAKKAAGRLADRRGFAAIEYVDQETGDRWLRGTEPALPGRQPLCRLISRGARR